MSVEIGVAFGGGTAPETAAIVHLGALFFWDLLLQAGSKRSVKPGT